MALLALGDCTPALDSDADVFRQWSLRAGTKVQKFRSFRNSQGKWRDGEGEPGSTLFLVCTGTRGGNDVKVRSIGAQRIYNPDEGSWSLCSPGYPNCLDVLPLPPMAQGRITPFIFHSNSRHCPLVAEAYTTYSCQSKAFHHIIQI